jgi:hypothetical protein
MQLTTRPANLGIGLLVATCCVLSGCQSESPTFGRVEKREVIIADFEDLELPGQARLAYQAEVLDGMTHPEFIVRWTNTTRDVVVDLYIVRLEDYDPDLPPNAQPNMFWTSARAEGSFGDPQTHAHVHPEPGTWVIFFFNPADAGRRNLFADLSADIRLTHFSSE